MNTLVQTICRVTHSIHVRCDVYSVRLPWSYVLSAACSLIGVCGSEIGLNHSLVVLSFNNRRFGMRLKVQKRSDPDDKVPTAPDAP